MLVGDLICSEVISRKSFGREALVNGGDVNSTQVNFIITYLQPGS